MLRKTANTLGEIRRRSPHFNEVGDACGRSKAEPVDKFGVIPNAWLLPQHVQVIAKRGLCLWMFREGDPLGDV